MKRKLYKNYYIDRKLYKEGLYDDKTKWIKKYMEGEPL